MEQKSFTISESIVLLKDGFNQLITQSELPIDVIIYVLKDYINELQTLGNQYQNQVYESLNKKMEELQAKEDAKALDEKIKEENPDLKVSIVNKEEK